jgi:hypothetical protein
LTGTVTFAVDQPVSTASLIINVLELVLLYLGGRPALLLNGPGRLSFDAGIVPELLNDLSTTNESKRAYSLHDAVERCAIPVTVISSSRH